MRKLLYAGICLALAMVTMQACSDSPSGSPAAGKPVEPISWRDIQRAHIPTFEQQVARLGLELTAEQRQELESTGHVFGVIPREHLPVRHGDGIVETTPEIRKALQKASHDYEAQVARGESGPDPFFVALVKNRSIDINDPIHRLRAYNLVVETQGDLEGFDGLGEMSAALLAAGKTCQQRCTANIDFAYTTGTNPTGNSTSRTVSCSGPSGGNAESLTTTASISCVDIGTGNCASMGWLVKATYPLSSSVSTNLNVNCSDIDKGASASSAIAAEVSSDEACGQGVATTSQSQSVSLKVGSSSSGVDQSTSQLNGSAHYTQNGAAAFDPATKKFKVEGGSSTELDLQTGATHSSTRNHDSTSKSESHSVLFTGNMSYVWYVPANGMASRTTVMQTSGCTKGVTSSWYCSASASVTLNASTTGLAGVSLATCPSPSPSPSCRPAATSGQVSAMDDSDICEMSYCGDYTCDTDFGEDCSTCSMDCGPCSSPSPSPAYCGDYTCDTGLGEDCSTCSVDCGPCSSPTPSP
ncbi:MAG TPA: hypothetical protein VLQ93_07595 [Myxococcaceae bacterium]|nr:hypothetical protein [Myxococcaceae bacterium]